jgi:hypothetical protein
MTRQPRGLHGITDPRGARATGGAVLAIETNAMVNSVLAQDFPGGK